jgi:hypothetical protein
MWHVLRVLCIKLMKNRKMKSTSFTYKITKHSLIKIATADLQKHIIWVYTSPMWGTGPVQSVQQWATGWMAEITS